MRLSGGVYQRPQKTPINRLSLTLSLYFWVTFIDKLSLLLQVPFMWELPHRSSGWIPRFNSPWEVSPLSCNSILWRFKYRSLCQWHRMNQKHIHLDSCRHGGLSFFMHDRSDGWHTIWFSFFTIPPHRPIKGYLVKSMKQISVILRLFCNGPQGLAAHSHIQ